MRLLEYPRTPIYAPQFTFVNNILAAKNNLPDRQFLVDTCKREAYSSELLRRTKEMAFTTEQLQAADAIDELKVGEGIEFACIGGLNGGYVERESPTRYRVNGSEAMCFIEACDAVFTR